MLLLVCKGLAYGLSLSGFRGGPTFPAMFLGAAGGMALSHLPGLPLVAGAAMGIGAMSAVMLRLPLTSVLLATLLLSSDGLVVMPLAIVAVVVSYVASARLSPELAPAGQRPAPAGPAPAGAGEAGPAGCRARRFPPAGQVISGSTWAVSSTVANRSPRRASRSGMSADGEPVRPQRGVVQFGPADGGGHRRAGRGARAVRRDQGLVGRVLRVVQPGQPAPLAHVPLPADQLRHHGADGLGQLLHPGPGVLEAGPGGDRDPDLDPAPPGELGLGPHPEMLQGGAVQPGQHQDVLPGGRRPRVDVDQGVTRLAAAAAAGAVQACHSSAPKLAAHTSAAGSSATR